MAINVHEVLEAFGRRNSSCSQFTMCCQPVIDIAAYLGVVGQYSATLAVWILMTTMAATSTAS